MWLDGKQIPEAKLRCADCGAQMRLTMAHIREERCLFYGCITWPECKGTHGAHADGSPKGYPVNAEGREARKAAHRLFDQLWERGYMSREEAYAWLAEQLCLTPARCHIAMFDLDTCQAVEVLAEQHLDLLSRQRSRTSYETHVRQR